MRNEQLNLFSLSIKDWLMHIIEVSVSPARILSRKLPLKIV